MKRVLAERIKYVGKMKNKKLKKSSSKVLLPIGCIVFILCLMFYPKVSVNAASKGLRLWADVVFPSLFPFFVASELLEGSGFVHKIGKLLEPIMRPLFNVPGCGAFILAMGVTSGYPVGAKITTELKKQNMVSKNEAERLLAFTNNSGPLFLIGAVATGMFGLPMLGFVLLGSHILASVSVGLIFGIYSRRKTVSKDSTFKKSYYPSPYKPIQFTTAFGNAVSNSVFLLLKICGFIVLFSVIINLLLQTGFINIISAPLVVLLHPLGIEQTIINAVFSGIFEITTAINMIASADNIPLASKAAIASLIAGWAGLSVHAQVSSITSEQNLRLKPYLFGKLLQGFISCIYTYLFMIILGDQITRVSPAFQNIMNPVSNLMKPNILTPIVHFGFSTAIIVFFATISLLLSLILKEVVKTPYKNEMNKYKNFHYK